MDAIITLINAIAQSAAVTDAGLSVVIISLLLLLYKQVFKPVQDKMDSLPSKDDLKSLIKESTDIEEFSMDELDKKMDTMFSKLDKMSEKINELEDLGKGNYREARELRRDIETIKQILNQFQGHMMYGGRRSSEYGNQELR